MEGRFSNRYLAGIHTVARTASRTLLWLRNMGQRPERTPFSKSSAFVGPNSSQGT